MNKIIVSDPFAGSNVFNNVEALFDSMLRDTFNTVNRSPISTTLKKVSYPKVDIRDTHDTVYIDATVPGLKSEDINIDFDDGYIKVSAEKQGEVDGEFVHREIHRSSFSRWFPVDVKIFDVEQISANIEDGILTIAVPKREEAKKPLPRKIEVK